ncbi:hypothetical protein CDQ92_15095 [Sphingopyxis bauzanensis]|uniref:Uncharacterized protein n=1 Tax=Sphingopyxis bauzanensis TaxID=651663 RepID=A0A246JU53_9SPHN|nr:hypothetical protein [Sphingopyxis bauzanensis]OWQ96052.1 hypothetical protein CDQ92_15095 [Sphingopyxis bauzanensis]GGJ52644.1 hypothetical protein GCM10011393_23600 [Sphingopyxis bauzanensis]
MSEEKSPSETLAAQIVDQLIQSGLVRTEKRDSVVIKIASGEMKGLDWKNEIDLAAEKAATA